jgi:uncharacterized protein YebE (UPF0316 family)
MGNSSNAFNTEILRLVENSNTYVLEYFFNRIFESDNIMSIFRGATSINFIGKEYEYTIKRKLRTKIYGSGEEL